MKLLLTSAGITNDSIANALSDLIGKPLNKTSVAFILTAKNNRDVPALEAMVNQIAQLRDRRIQYVLVDPSFDSDWQEKLANVEVVIIGGGNTFHLLNETRKTGFAEWLRTNLDKKVYVGIGAGSILMTPNIAVASIDDGDENTPHLTDLTGLGFVDFEVSPHTPEDVSVEANLEYTKTTANRLLMFDNSSAALIDNGEVKLITEGYAQLIQPPIAQEQVIEVFIFDVDGTLVDSEPLHNHAWEQALANIRKRGTTLDDKVLQAISGKKPIEIARMFVDGLQLESTPEELLRHKTDLFIESIDENLKPMPGAIEIVKKIHETGKKIAIGTSLDRQLLDKILATLDIVNKFDVIVTGDEIANGKPNPETYLKVIEKLDVKPSECIVFEDSRAGIQSAQSAGCRVIAIRQGDSKDIADLIGVEKKTSLISSFDDVSIKN